MLFSLDVANNTILFSFFLFFLIIHLYFITAAVIAEIFKPIAKLVTLIRILSKGVKAKTEIHRVIVEAKIRKCSI